MNYNELNAHPRDPYLKFDPESHTYTLGDRILLSVTNIVEDCFPKFDADYWALRKAPGMGMTPDELKARWEANATRSRSLGTEMHEKIERYYLRGGFRRRRRRLHPIPPLCSSREALSLPDRVAHIHGGIRGGRNSRLP